jgi:hypothetical protein
MTDWVEAWRYCGRTRLIAKRKKALKRNNHRKNRLMAKKLDTQHVRLNGWDVS